MTVVFIKGENLESHREIPCEDKGRNGAVLLQAKVRRRCPANYEKARRKT